MTLVDFFKVAINLKCTPRKGWITKLNIHDGESVADHSYSVAIMAMIISDIKKINSEKAIKMSLLHDLAESQIGDITPGQISITKKEEMEDAALTDIFKNLPKALQSEYHTIWKEYKENRTLESRLIHQIDKLDMALQAVTYSKKIDSVQKIQPFLESSKKYIVDPQIKQILNEIIYEVHTDKDNLK